MFARNLVPRLLIGPLSEITEIATIKILQTSTERWLVVIMLISPVFSKILIYAGIFLQMMFLRESILHTAKYGHTASERVLCEQGSRLLFTKNNTNHFIWDQTWALGLRSILWIWRYERTDSPVQKQRMTDLILKRRIFLSNFFFLAIPQGFNKTVLLLKGLVSQ